MGKLDDAKRAAAEAARGRAERRGSSPPERKAIVAGPRVEAPKKVVVATQPPVTFTRRYAPTRLVNMRVTGEEREVLLGAAGGDGLSVWARAVLLREARKR